MVTHQEFLEKIEVLQEEIKTIDTLDEPEKIEQTAKRLTALNYAPSVGIPRDRFLRLTRESLLGEIRRIAEQANSLVTQESSGAQGRQEMLQQISVLVFYFRELSRLRQDVPEAWDGIDERYVND